MLIALREKIYPLEAIYSSCCQMMDDVYFFLDYDSKKKSILVSFTPKKKVNARVQQKLKNRFMQALIEWSLRCEVSKKSKKIREYIIGRALYSSLPTLDVSLIDEKADYKEDSLGIAVPWEKQEAKRKNHR